MWKVSFDRKELLDAVKLASRVVPKNHPNYALQHVKLAASDGGVSVEATDLEAHIRIKLADAQTEGEEGAVLFPAKRLSSLLRCAKRSRMTVAARPDGTVEVSDGLGSSRESVECCPDDFPLMRVLEPVCRVPGQLLLNAASRTAFATDSSALRYALGGIRLEVEEDGGLAAIGTDGRRLCLQTGRVSFLGDAAAMQGIVPVRDICLVEYFSNDPEMEMAIDENYAMFQSKTVQLSTRLLEGRFPPWRDVRPGTDPVVMEFRVDPLTEAMRQATVPGSPCVLVITLAGNRMRIVGHGDGTSASSVSVPIIYGSPPLQIRLNAFYLLEGLRALPAKGTALMELWGSGEIMSLRTNDGDYHYYLMPMGKEPS